MLRHHQTQRGPAVPAIPTSSLKPSLPSHVAPAVKAGTQSGGQALDKHTSAEMSAKFGHSFSQVRIHTDSRAGDAADAMGANAFALGGDIVFGAGKYNPGSLDTERILAHELTHVVQQARSGPGDWGRTSSKGDASEREADSLASQVMMGQRVSVSAAPGAAVARDIDGDAISGAIGDKLHDWLHMGPFTLNPIVEPKGGPQIGPDPPDAHDNPQQQRQDDFEKDQAKLHGYDYPNPFDPQPPPSATVPLPLPGPRVPQPDPPGDFMPPAQPDPNPPYMPPPFQYTPTPYPGLGQSDPIAPFPAPPDVSQPLPPPSLFSPSPSPLPPMVPPLTLDPGTLTPPNVDAD
jgi:hypothetical protein